MSNQITYDDKVDLNIATDVQDINKVTAADMNEIKQVVNAIDSETSTNITDILQAINNPTYTTTEGTDLSIDNTRVGKMKFRYGGGIEQESTNGYNLLPYQEFVTKTISGVTITNNNDGTYTVNGTATADASVVVYDTFMAMSGTWRMLGCPTGGSASTYMLSAYVGYWGEGSPNIDTGNGTNITYTGNVKIRFYIKNGTTCNNLIFKPMLTTNTSLTINDFEKYTGGIASPNPDYPQEVKTVTGDNTINLIGRNLLDESTLRQGSGFNPTDMARVFFPSNYYLEAGTYTLITNLNTSIYKYAVGIGTNPYPTPVSYVHDTGWQTSDHVTFTISQRGYLGVGVAKSDGTSSLTPSDISSYHFILYKGSYDSSITYEPYQSQSYPINLGANVVDCSEFNTTTSGGITATPYWGENGLLFMKSSGTYSSAGYFNIANNIKLQPNIKYTINKSNYSGAQYRLREYDANNTQLSETFVGQSDVIITSNSNVHHAVLQIVFYTTVNAKFYPQITKGTTAKKYQPYFTPIELCDIEGHQDYIYNNGGKWFKHKEVGKIIDSSGSTGITINEMVNNGSIFSYCGGTVNAKTITYASAISTTNYIYYQLATPIEEEITETTLINQLNAIKYGAESYYGQTNIMITSEELQPTLKVQTLDKIGD